MQNPVQAKQRRHCPTPDCPLHAACMRAMEKALIFHVAPHWRLSVITVFSDTKKPMYVFSVQSVALLKYWKPTLATQTSECINLTPHFTKIDHHISYPPHPVTTTHWSDKNSYNKYTGHQPACVRIGGQPVRCCLDCQEGKGRTEIKMQRTIVEFFNQNNTHSHKDQTVH